MKPIPPCKNCKDRNATCHIEGNCAEYDKFRKDYEEWVNTVKVERDLNAIYLSCVIGWRDTALRDKRNHKLC